MHLVSLHSPIRRVKETTIANTLILMKEKEFPSISINLPEHPFIIYICIQEDDALRPVGAYMKGEMRRCNIRVKCSPVYDMGVKARPKIINILVIIGVKAYRLDR